jgi:hypothetical protein
VAHCLAEVLAVQLVRAVNQMDDHVIS